MNNMKVLHVLAFVLFSSAAYSQENTLKNEEHEDWNYFSLQGSYKKGHVFGTNAFLRGDNQIGQKIDVFQAVSLKLSHQTTGSKQWQQIFKYPDWGVGLYAGDFYNPEEIGVPISLYSFFNAPFIRKDKFSFNYQLAFGISFNWQSFNPQTNKFNIAIGAGESFFIDAGLNVQYGLSNKLDLLTGFNLTHFSNGALKKPNFGINTISPQISLKYNFNGHPTFHLTDIPKYEDHSEWLVSAFVGEQNVIFDSVDINIQEKYEGVFFPEIGLSTVYNRQVNYKSKIGIGMSVSYNGALNAQVAVNKNELDPVDEPFEEKLQVSIFPSYELVVHKMSLVLRPAFYIYRKKVQNPTPQFYQKIGLKYHFSTDMFAGVILRNYAFHVSSFIEWTVGYRLK